MLIIPAVISQAYYERGSLGMGIQLGEPTGLTLKYKLTPSTALDATAGYNFLGKRITGQADFLVIFPIEVYRGELSIYLGMGLVAGTDTTSAEGSAFEGGIYIAGQVPLGAEYKPGIVGLYAEGDLRLNFFPDNNLGYGGGIGLRFYF